MLNSSRLDLAIHGTSQNGADVQSQNLNACLSISNIVRSSLGPVGLSKMIVDETGDVTLTSDGSTILKLLDVRHPAAKILVELAKLQDSEIGDGTTSVVIIASELLRKGNGLMHQKIHPTSIIGGFRIAMKKACQHIKTHQSIPIEKLNEHSIINAAQTSLNSKIIRTLSDFFAKLVVNAILSVRESGSSKINAESHRAHTQINMIKVIGGAARDSRLLPGYAMNMGRAASGMPSLVQNAKIACLELDLRKSKMHTGVAFTVSDAKALEKIHQRESDICKERIQMIQKAGANVILTTKGIDDTALQYLVAAGIIACRRVPPEDLKRIARATGANIVLSLADQEGNDNFDSSLLGEAEQVSEEYLANTEMIIFKNCKECRFATFLIRGANEYLLEEIERSLYDALCVISKMFEGGSVVPGGGAIEANLSVFLEKFATSFVTREQLAIAEFADALLVIPKTLAVNAAKDATELVARLRSCHYTSLHEPVAKKFLAQFGLDLELGAVRNNVEAGILEPAISKLKMIQFATEATITILRIDNLIKLDPHQEHEGE